MRRLEQLLREVDHKPYPAYKSLKGRYTFQGFVLSIDHVQGDPFAAPSSLSIHLEAAQHGFPKDFYAQVHRRIMLQDYLLRGFHKELGRYSHKAGGSGKSGTLSVSSCGQEVLERSALTISPADGSLVLRFSAGFPAAGRTTLAQELKKMLFEYVPACVAKTLRYAVSDKAEIQRWLSLADDQKAIREQLSKKGLVAFVANGAILPRKSGVDDRPMQGAVEFISPSEDAITLSLPGGRTISGLGIKKGITLIVGGGYHGKSTLLKALERGVYNHVPGDGREYVITEDTAMKLRSEDGRSVKQLDISAFIRDLPSKRDTRCFSTEDASGSTSQAACTVEAILAGSRTLLIDEDTSATNFMVRDGLMQKVIHPGEEPIIPFLSRMRQLYEELGISTILVAGSSGAFFEISDTILQMREYKPIDITAKAKEAAKATSEKIEAPDGLTISADRRVPFPNKEVTESRKVKVRGNGTDAVSINHESVELRFVEQVVDNEQTNLLGALLRTLEEQYFNGRDPLPKCVTALYERLTKQGFAACMSGNRGTSDGAGTKSSHDFASSASGSVPGNLAMVRPQELWAMVNRYRGLRLQSAPTKKA
ncbi:MAG: ABC-ATPase domain-containing protein [Lachnospiraceae bacterium]|nr:ABC-ATPase domain-containing protein [Lachnospiraceae bacterium]